MLYFAIRITVGLLKVPPPGGSSTGVADAAG
jgi:hypothetical protein